MRATASVVVGACVVYAATVVVGAGAVTAVSSGAPPHTTATIRKTTPLKESVSNHQWVMPAAGLGVSELRGLSLNESAS